jgi:transglutaminase-like putative cysteine protease
MLIHCGYAITLECTQPTSMLLHLNVHTDRAGDLRSPDMLKVTPHVPLRQYVDRFGNIVTRLEAPAGAIRFSADFVIEDNGLPDMQPPETALAPVHSFPDEVLTFLMPSRYVDSDLLLNSAWENFAGCKTTAEMVRRIVAFAHERIRFDYSCASVFRTAHGGYVDQVGVCRDFAHLAVALCRAMNIPARYCTGYLGDIGVPADPAPMDFSAWFEVFIDGNWYSFDARHKHPRIGRIVMARGKDAADVAITTSFGFTKLVEFTVTTNEVVEPVSAEP